MLKKILVRDLRLGMHLHSLSGPWLDHPFWRTRFVLTDPADLARLHGCGIQECVIDTAKGLDVLPQPTLDLEAVWGQSVLEQTGHRACSRSAIDTAMP